MKTIQITLRKDGTQKVEALNCTGPEGKDLTRVYEERLGTPEGERTLKAEYHETVQQSESERARVQEGGA